MVGEIPARSQMSGLLMISEDRYIEILTAAVQRVTITDADIQWNVKIGNRQFDVLATINAGLHKILLGYEVKHKSRPVSVDAIDAFVTKAKDAGINKLVFVSTSGFQSGCIETAKRHGVDLFKLEILPSGLPGIPESHPHMVVSKAGSPAFDRLKVDVVKENEPMNVVEQLDLHYDDGSRITLPDEPTQMAYYVENSTLSDGTSLAAAIQGAARTAVELDKTERRRIELSGTISPPDFFFIKAGRVNAAVLHIRGVLGTVISSNARFELSSVRLLVRYTEIATGGSIEVPANALPVGNNNFKPGKYYFLYDPLRYFYCDRLEGDIAHIYLVESFQSGQIIQAVFTQANIYSKYYFELSDKKIEERLKQRLSKMKAPSALNQKKPFPLWRR